MDDDMIEATSRLEMDAIEAMQTLVETYEYEEDDLDNLVKLAMGR